MTLLELVDRGASPALLAIAALLLARPLPPRAARWAWSALLAVALGYALVLDTRPANFPAGNFDHYWLGAKYPLPYAQTYRVILAGEDRPQIGMRDLEHPERRVRADTTAQRAYWIDLLRASHVAFDPLVPLDSLAARARASGALAAEGHRTLAAALPAGRIEGFRRDVRAMRALGQGEGVTLDYGYNGSPFYGLVRQLDPTLRLPFGRAVAWAGLLFQVLGVALVAFLAGLALGLTLEERLALAALIVASQNFATMVLPGLVFTEAWAPMLVAAWAMRRGRSALAGMAIAVAGLVKLFPFLLILPAVVALARSLAPGAREQGVPTAAARASRRGALVLLGSCALSTLALGAASVPGGWSWPGFLHKVVVEFQTGTNMINSVSVSALLSALGVRDHSPLPPLAACVSLVLLAAMFWRPPATAANDTQARRALVLVGATGWMVRSWLNYYAVTPFLLLPLLARRHRGAAVVMVLAMAGTYALPPIDDPSVVANGGLHALELLGYLAIPAWLVWFELRGGGWSAPAVRAALGALAALVLLTAAVIWRDRAVTADLAAGTQLLDARNPREALVSLDHALHLAPGNAAAHRQRGIALAELGRLDEALPAFARATALEPDDDGAHYDYGRALAMSGRLADAATEFERASALEPDDVQVLIALARTRLDAGRAAEAAKLLARARELQPGEPQIAGLMSGGSAH